MTSIKNFVIATDYTLYDLNISKIAEHKYQVKLFFHTHPEHNRLLFRKIYPDINLNEEKMYDILEKIVEESIKEGSIRVYKFVEKSECYILDKII